MPARKEGGDEAACKGKLGFRSVKPNQRADEQGGEEKIGEEQQQKRIDEAQL